MEFQVKKKSWCGSFCLKGNPKIVGYLSMDKNGKCSEDLSQLKYYIPHNETDDVYFYLNDGYHKAIKKRVIPPNNIDDLLHWVQMHNKLVKRKMMDG
ncbi:uncharacterized protein LOC117169052 isoform X2 [Belonocnema kinseyi]|uniref:uncharacterized protein LOC117169052 isoform X2 n=1 Tax=Belonocnema kinseyi TaxID=2817044 RepID=UPI00143D7A78|nr:uncharacterized protein LOC117169052 isoform X2 [Belonocnema kinseyi]